MQSKRHLWQTAPILTTARKHFNLQRDITRSGHSPTIIIFYSRLRLRTQIKTNVSGPAGRSKLYASLIARRVRLGRRSKLLLNNCAGIRRRNNWSSVVANRQLVSETILAGEMKRSQEGQSKHLLARSVSASCIYSSSDVHNSSV